METYLRLSRKEECSGWVFGMASSDDCGRKPVVVQHVVQRSVGGPNSQLRLLLESKLTKEFQFEVVEQRRRRGLVKLDLVLEMARRMRAAQPDIVHVRGLQNSGFLGVLAARWAGCRKIVVSVHGSTQDAVGGSWWKRWVETRVFEPLTIRWATGVYCVCEAMAIRPVICRNAKRNFGVIHNGMHIRDPMPRDPRIRAQLDIPSDAVVGLCASRVTREKGVEQLMEAMKQLHVRGMHQPYLVVAGDGDYLQEAKHRVMSDGLNHRVRILGPRLDIEQILAAADFFVMPTLHENLSNSLLEAMHAGKAVVTTSVGGNVELVQHGETGLLVPPNDLGALVEAMMRMVNEPSTREEFGAAGRRRIIEHFRLDDVVDRLGNVYRELLAAE